MKKLRDTYTFRAADLIRLMANQYAAGMVHATIDPNGEMFAGQVDAIPIGNEEEFAAFVRETALLIVTFRRRKDGTFYYPRNAARLREAETDAPA